MGMMGAGKTTIGRALERASGLVYVDNDVHLAHRTGADTRSLAQATGPEQLHAAEVAQLREALDADVPGVVAAAAGVVDQPEGVQLLREAFVVYLRARPETLAARVGAGEGRPWLDGDPLAWLTSTLARRAECYEELADVVVDVDDAAPEQLAERILSARAERRA
jgi:shikimate kinase